MIGKWCNIDENRFCQEGDCQGCQIYYLYLLDFDKMDIHLAKSLSSVNSAAVSIKPSGISSRVRVVCMDDR